MPLQVVVPPLLQQHVAFASLEVDVAQCTQPPFPHAPTGLKHVRKERQCKGLAERGGSRAIPQRTCRSKKVTTLDNGLPDLAPMLQTPMPGSDVGNDYGPPPPDSTPVRQRGKSCVCCLWSVAVVYGCGRLRVAVNVVVACVIC